MMMYADNVWQPGCVMQLFYSVSIHEFFTLRSQLGHKVMKLRVYCFDKEIEREKR